MDKYLFTPIEETMKTNGKDEAALINLTANVITKYGTVEPYTPPIVGEAISVDKVINDVISGLVDANEGVKTIIISETDYESLKNDAISERLRADSFEQELKLYAPFIDVAKAFAAADKATIERLTKEIEEKSNSDIELNSLKEKIKAMVG